MLGYRLHVFNKLAWLLARINGYDTCNAFENTNHTSSFIYSSRWHKQGLYSKRLRFVILGLELQAGAGSGLRVGTKLISNQFRARIRFWHPFIVDELMLDERSMFRSVNVLYLGNQC